MQLCHSGLSWDGDTVLVAQKGWFVEGSKGLRGDADWISEEQVRSAYGMILSHPEKPVLGPRIFKEPLRVSW